MGGLNSSRNLWGVRGDVGGECCFAVFGGVGYRVYGDLFVSVSLVDESCWPDLCGEVGCVVGGVDSDHGGVVGFDGLCGPAADSVGDLRVGRVGVCADDLFFVA